MKLARINFAEDIEVLVGPSKTRFHVHKDIICPHSTFFRAASSQRWNENAHPIELPEDTPEIFNAYLLCVYKNPDVFDGLCSNNEDERTKGQCNLLKVYALADKLGDLISVNGIVDVLLESMCDTGETPHPSVIELALALFPEGTPMHQLFVDHFVHEAPASEVKRLCESKAIPRQFLGSILVEKTKLESDHQEETINKVFDNIYTIMHECRYHHHNKDHPNCGNSCERVNGTDEA